MKLKNLIPAIIIFTTLAVNFSFGFPRLVKFSSVDEHLWTYNRTPQFWHAVERLRWRSTHINDKPGITIAIISGAGFFGGINPKPYKKLRLGEGTKTKTQVGIMKKINFNFRLPIYLFTLLMAPIFYILLKKLLGEAIALFSVIIIYLSPVLLGMSIIINPDSLTWIFVPLSLISFFIFQKNMEKKYAILSGFFFGLALLTKYISSILYPFFIFLILASYIFSKHKRNNATYFKKSLTGYAIIILISTLTVITLYPASWVNSKYIPNTTFFSHPFNLVSPYIAGLLVLFYIDTFLLNSKFTLSFLSLFTKYKKYILQFIILMFLIGIAFILVDVYSNMRFYDFQSAMSSFQIPENTSFIPKIFINGVLSGTYILIFSLTPIVFLFFLYPLLASFFKKMAVPSDEILIVFYLLVFIMIYYIAFSANNIYATARYQISIYPLVSIIAAIGFYRFISLKNIRKYIPIWGAYILLIAISTISLFLTKPYYFAYTSKLLPQEYTLNLNDMGEGSYQAATYLNSLPNAQNIKIWADQVAVCEYFVGNCQVSLRKRNIHNIYYDYYVLSSGRKTRTITMSGHRGLSSTDIANFKNAYASNNPSNYKIVIDNRPNCFVKVVKNPNSKK